MESKPKLKKSKRKRLWIEDLVLLLVDYSIYIPSIFSPNNDGINDRFEACLSDGIETNYEMLIRARWGKVVFNRKGEQMFWDGQFDGKEASPGVYSYFIVLRLVNGEEVLEQGTMCLLR